MKNESCLMPELDFQSKRPRKLRRRLIFVFACLALLPSLVHAQSVKINGGFSLGGGDLPSYFQTADVDRDGNLDIIGSYSSKVGSYGGLYWFKGPQLGIHKIWPAYNLTDPNQLFFSAVVDDFDNDGQMDLIGVMGQDLDMIKNIADPSTRTLQHLQLLSGLLSHYDIVSGDLNKDGYKDFVGYFFHLSWYENQRDGITSFTEHQIPSVITEPYKIILQDMDGDGNLDIVIGGYNGTAIYNNNGAKSPVFTEDILTTSTIMFDVVDFNRDGKPDIMTKGSGIFWYENLGGNPPQYIRHEINTDQGLSAYKVCDLDQDGDLDIVGARHYPDTDTWYLAYLENQGDWPPSFKFHLLKKLDYDMAELQIVHLLDKNRWQFVTEEWSPYNPLYPMEWINIYDTIVTPAPKTCVHLDQWPLYR